MSAKEEIMGRIRRALSDSPGSRGEETPALDRSQPMRSEDEGLVSQFRGEMEKLGGRVVDADSEQGINEYIDGLVRQAKRVAVSDLVSAQWPGICSRLRAKDIEIVPSLGEFAAGPTDSGAKIAARVGGDQGPLFAGVPKEQAAGEKANGSGADLMERYKLSLFDAEVGITTADYAIADTGTLVLLSKKSPDSIRNSGVPSETAEAAGQPGQRGEGGLPPNGSAQDAGAARTDGEQHRLISLVPPIHCCLLDRRRIVSNLTELLTLVHKDYYLKGGPPLAMTFISGPSRTADIELTLTKGVHGPREVHVLLWG